MNIYGILDLGKPIVGHSAKHHLLIVWNKQDTFSVYAEDGGWFTEKEKFIIPFTFDHVHACSHAAFYLSNLPSEEEDSSED